MLAYREEHSESERASLAAVVAGDGRLKPSSAVVEPYTGLTRLGQPLGSLEKPDS
jgi:hypothetical protein